MVAFGPRTNALDMMVAEPIDVNAVMKEALRLRRSGDRDGAYRQLRAAIDSVPKDDRELLAELLSFAGDLYHEDGAFLEAKRAYEDALAASDGSAYRRYVLELSLGALHEQSGEAAIASRRYVAAIETALSVDDVSAGAAIRRLVNLKKNQLTDAERQVCERAIEHSWKVLDLPGTPDTSDIGAASSTLIDAAGADR